MYSHYASSLPEIEINKPQINFSRGIFDNVRFRLKKQNGLRKRINSVKCILPSKITAQKNQFRRRCLPYIMMWKKDISMQNKNYIEQMENIKKKI